MTERKCCENPSLVESELGPDSKCENCGELYLTIEQAVACLNRDLS